MDLKSLEKEMHAFVRSKGWYDDDSPKVQSPRNLAISLVLEASEVLEHFQWKDDVDDKEAFADELADVMLYLLQLSSICDIDLGAAVQNKLKKNHERTWE